MISIAERLAQQGELLRRITDKTSNNIRVAIPGVVVSVNASQQTVTVQPAVKERVNLNGVLTSQSLPLLLDVPLVLPRAGGYLLTLPISPGDEVLVIFGDACIDGWWQSGGVQNQIDRRRHDLSDGFAIPGPWSQPRRVSDYSADSVQLRTEDGDTLIEIKGTTINVTAAETVNVTAETINVTSTGSITIKAATQILFDCAQVALGAAWSGLRKLMDLRMMNYFNNHVHAGVTAGIANTGTPTVPLAEGDANTTQARGI